MLWHYTWQLNMPGHWSQSFSDTKQCWTNVYQHHNPHWTEACFSSQETEQCERKEKSSYYCRWPNVRAAGEGLKGEEKLTTYLNRLWKQFHLSPLAGYQLPDGALIIKNANCKNAANLAPPDLFSYFSWVYTTKQKAWHYVDIFAF